MKSKIQIIFISEQLSLHFILTDWTDNRASVTKKKDKLVLPRGML
jgi:hypothetical protein